jgi:hypothetical protein
VLTCFVLSLEALRKAISKLIDIPLDNLILFHSSGSQLSESLYHELGHIAAADSFTRSGIYPSHPNHPARRIAGQRNHLQYDLNGNEIRTEEEDKGISGISLYAFDRESFMAEPHEFVKGIEEDLTLPDALPGKMLRHGTYLPCSAR